LLLRQKLRNKKQRAERSSILADFGITLLQATELSHRLNHLARTSWSLPVEPVAEMWLAAVVEPVAY
jgi:hypothetical protein